MGKQTKVLSASETTALLAILEQRFAKNMQRHPELVWSKIAEKLLEQPEKLWSLEQMEATEGEPDVIAYNSLNDAYLFCDCSSESPKLRRSICYDHEALEARKEHKPANSAINMAAEMGIDVMDETQYRLLQSVGSFDCKTSSWLKTPDAIRALDGAIFGDRRYNHVFIYHNGVQSYYGARAFRGIITI